MSKNLSHLSFRKGIEKNLFGRMVTAADETGTAESPDFVRSLGEESLFGDAVTLGAFSFFDFTNSETAAKKILIFNGSACLCVATR